MFRLFPKFPLRGVICQDSAQLLAVAALDDLVTSLVKDCGLEISPQFFDWIADEATPMVELFVERFFRNDRFIASLQVGDPKIAMSLWVRHWICPQIAARFDQLAHHVINFSETDPAALQSEISRFSHATLKYA